MNTTQQNLLRAFAGESMARNKYTTFAKIARKENQEWIARIFEETADNEKAHAEELFELIKDNFQIEGKLEIKPYANTSDNLKMAAEGEKYEWTTMYPDFESQAKEDNGYSPKQPYRCAVRQPQQNKAQYQPLNRDR